MLHGLVVEAVHHRRVGRHLQREAVLRVVRRLLLAVQTRALAVIAGPVRRAIGAGQRAARHQKVHQRPLLGAEARPRRHRRGSRAVAERRVERGLHLHPGLALRQILRRVHTGHALRRVALAAVVEAP